VNSPKSNLLISEEGNTEQEWPISTNDFSRLRVTIPYDVFGVIYPEIFKFIYLLHIVCFILEIYTTTELKAFSVFIITEKPSDVDLIQLYIFISIVPAILKCRVYVCILVTKIRRANNKCPPAHVY
jgi:hypothetical protein